LREVESFGRKLVLVHGSQLAPDSELRFTREEDVPRELALCMVGNQHVDSMHPFSVFLLPWAAKLTSPEELYLPEELARVVRQEPTPEQMVKAYERQNVGAPPPPATRDANKPGRNEPCRCGSGKKYKKCCGP
jgi:uncharacterized protein YecA (UPF0149 family)